MSHKVTPDLQYLVCHLYKKSAIEVGMLQMVLLLIQPHQHEPQSDSRSSISRLSHVQKQSAIEVGMLQMVL